MSYQGYQGIPQNGSWTGHTLHHQVSVLSNLGDDEEDNRRSRLAGRDSLVSLQSQYESPPLEEDFHGTENAYQSQTSWSAPFVGSTGGAYEPLSTSSIRDQRNSKPGRERRFFGKKHDTIAEDESYDMSLLNTAAPMGKSQPYNALLDIDPVDGEAAYDVTTFMGPPSSQDNEFWGELQKQEAGGKLTLGLGAGMAPSDKVRSGDLLAKTPINQSPVSRSFSRSFSLRGKPKPATPRAQIRGLGQDEANKRGEVIEVIIEEEENVTGASNVDLSSTVPNFFKRPATMTETSSKTEIFYPQPNWKPFPMRWPYLSSLIVISIVLAISAELVLQKSRKKPLLEFHLPSEITASDYFVLKFVPTIITVTYGVLWSITDFEVKRLEAYYQMSKKEGALAAESINVDYITEFSFLYPIHAIRRRHWAVVLSSIANLLAISAVPIFGSTAVTLSPDRATRLQHPEDLKTIMIRPVLSRLLSVTLILIGMLGAVLLEQLQSRRSGLLADVKGVAGVASMAVVSHIMMDFKDMDTARPKDIHNKLRDRRYVLRNSSLATDETTPVTTAEYDKYKETNLSKNPHPLMLRPQGSVPLIIGILLFICFIPVFLFVDPVSQFIEPYPWVATLFAILVKMGWNALDTDFRMMEPFYVLSKRHAPAKTLTIDYTAEPFAWVALQAIFNKHWLMAMVGFGTVLTETLTIFVTSLSTVEGKDFLSQIQQKADPEDSSKTLYAGQETTMSFVTALSLTSFILVYMAVVSITVFVRRRHPFLPRQPNTIASLLAFMHQSRMLYDFVGTSRSTSGEVARLLEGKGKTYGVGWFIGRDGQTHCGIDEEELLGNYKHGVSYADATKPWDGGDWQVF